MKLKVIVEKPVELRKCLSFLVSLRKMCVFRFTEHQLVIISSALNEPTVWCKLDSSVFQLYEVDSTRDKVIPFEINIEPLCQVLRNYEKSNVTSNLVIRLQRRPSNGMEVKNKAVASLALFYTEQISMSSNVSHSFNVPVRLLKMDSDLRIVEPAMDTMKLAMKLPMRIAPLLRRLDRYRTSDLVTITGNQLGQLKFVIEEEQRKIVVQWKEKLDVLPDQDESPPQSWDSSVMRPVSLKVKLKHWNVGSHLMDMCDAMSLIVHAQGGILHCYIDMDQKCDIAYYLNGYQTD
ncbi:hypothetical protein OGAPHI_001578 [Ogataea philodendri]|uniref:Checkpoint protein n=1 Tax=Ogataea philodendri TaxID=1378263 RepID=A0A9P8PCR2_9ASCO|nr:uncharacterized protein OGAPHI_001578 [Ogataea philodendri]KAH3669457.1 hypothetical protein OGAPHI_001578 [Ogataea philodendri]